MSRPKLASAFLGMCALGLGVSALGAACTATTNTSGTFTGGNAGTGANGQGNGGAGHGANGHGGDDIGFDSGVGNGGGSGGSVTACAAEPYEAKQAPLDMFIMLDQSGSMDGTVAGGQSKWQAVTGGLQTFLTQPGTNGISVGIQYFGVAPGGSQCGTFCATDADCGPAACGPCLFGTCFGGAAAGDSCNAADYAKPEVEITPLPGGASAILTSIAKHGPSTSTPTAPALQGAISHASQWSQTHPGHVTIAVFATDGIPSECSPTDTAGIAQIAAQGASAGIKTFAIGVFEPADFPEGPNLMNAIASQGGTGTAFIFDTTNPNVQGEFKKALDMIRGASLGCQYSIPVPMSGVDADPKKLNVNYTPGAGGPAVTFNRVLDKASCPAGADAWYYDDNLNPTQILLCDSTCSKVSADMTGKIDILLGCKTVMAE